MNNSISRKADAYVARLYSGDLTESEAAEIVAWKASSAAHREAMEASLAALSDVEDLVEDDEMQAFMEEATSRSLGNRVSRLWPIAAALAVAAIFMGQYLPERELDPQVSRYTTAIGERTEVTLEDGSRIQLNTNTDLIVSFTNKRREIFLSRGEAFFDVAKDTSRKFTVEAGTHSATVLGTEFNVYREDRRRITIAVFEGQVGLHRSDDEISTAAGRPSVTTPDQLVLSAGQVARVEVDGNIVAGEGLTENSTHGAWRTGKITFRDQPLSVVVNELNRYSVRPIIIQDSQSRRLPVYAVVELDHHEAVLDSLEIALPVQITRKADRILISTTSGSK